MHPDDLAVTRASIVRVMSGQSHGDFCSRYIHKNGSIVHILWSARWSEESGVRIGVACYPADGEDADTLLSHADHDMYRLKGRRLDLVIRA